VPQQKHAAALYAQAADFNKTARFYYMKAQDAYYLANAQASYDDWRRARRQWVSALPRISVHACLCVHLVPAINSDFALKSRADFSYLRTTSTAASKLLVRGKLGSWMLSAVSVGSILSGALGIGFGTVNYL